MQEFKAGPNNPEPQVRTAEVGTTGETCERSERTSEAAAAADC